MNLEIPSIWLRHRSWDSMTHDTCALILQCQSLVSRNCRKSPAKKAIQGHSGQILSFNRPQYFSLWQRKIRAWKTFLGGCSVRLRIPNYWRFCLMVQTCFKGMLFQWVRQRVRGGSLFNAIFFKVNPGFWSSWLTEDGSNTMKVGSQKAKGHKVREARERSTGSRRLGNAASQLCGQYRGLKPSRLKIQRNSGRKIGLVFKTILA